MAAEVPSLPLLTKCPPPSSENQEKTPGSKDGAVATPKEKAGAPKEGNSTGVPAAPQLLVLSHAHAPRQWQTIAEEFSSLLDKDFVDVLFKVEGGAILAAHRALVAAVWPQLREEVRNLKPAPEKLRIVGLAWVNSTAQPKMRRDFSVPLEPGTSPTDIVFTGDIDPALAIPPMARSISPAMAYGSEGEAIPEPEELTAEVGVLDVSKRDWGTWSIVRALFCHLYSRPVAIQESELQSLGAVAQRLGCWELAKNCEDASVQRNWHAPRKSETSDSEDQRSTANEVPSHAVSTDSDQFPALLNVGSRNQSETSEGDRGLTGHRTPEKSKSVAEETAPEKPPFSEARARSFVKPLGEGSFTHLKAASAEDSEEPANQSIRHVLSDLKRTMMEASRVISDKSFQSMYDMVSGDRGILGEGINGPVRMAVHKRTGREVAVKRISCVNLSEQRRQMLLSEVRIFLTVSHRNIIQLHEVYESEADQAVLLVMELCTGKELFERLAERKYYSELDASRVTRQMLDAVAYLHSQNICHRDLKLENWLYENPSPDAKLKLCDFGFGQIVEPSVQLTATLGSLYYVAPEVLEGSYGLPCDMWSMGVIVYMLLSGTPPFDGKTDQDVIGKIRQGRFFTGGKRWEGISETAKHFLHSILRKDPYERLSASECTQHAWLTMGATAGQHNMPKQISDISIDQSVIRDMTKFAQNNAITRAALGMLASSSSPFCGREEDVVELETRFKRFDGNNTGKIDAEEFMKTLRESLGSGSAEATKVFERISASTATESPKETSEPVEKKPRKREVNYSDFITLTKAKRVANNSAAIREAFRAFDKDGDGFITDNAICGILGEDFKGDEEMVKAILQKCDLNGEGLIDYVDFATAFSEELSKKGETQGVTTSNTSPIPPAPPAVEAPPEEKKQVEVKPVGEEVQEAPEVKVVKVNPPAAEETKPQVVTTEKLKTSEITQKEARKMSSPRERSKSSAATGEEQEDAEEDGAEDAHWESDGEEQLVSVKATKAGTQKVDGEKEKPKKDPPPKNPHYHSFSLSLAGSAEHDDVSAGVNRVISRPSDVYIIRQLPSFHKEILRPFYASKPVSNVCMGLIRGTSLYAKQSVAAKLATIIHTICGWYFIMPNPKYHKEVNDRKGLLSKETGKFRFVAWWIHPRFVPQLRRWFERAAYEGKEQERQEKKREQAERAREKWNAERAKTHSSTPSTNIAVEGDMKTYSPRHDHLDSTLSENDVGLRFDPEPRPEVPGSPHTINKKLSGDETVNLLSPRPRPSVKADEVPLENLEAKDATPPRGNGEKRAPSPQSAKMAAAGRVADPDPTGKDKSATAPTKIRADSDPTGKDKSDIKTGEYIVNEMGVGNPGDFQFSDVPKPENYLHTYRELHTREHIVMLSQLYEGTNRFLRTLFDDNFLASAQISAGFHYPVRTQYATLHMQVRVNSGSVCREDGRGIDIHDLIETLQSDRLRYYRDEEPLRYQVTENIKVSLLAAANEYSEQHPGVEVVRQTALLAYDLGLVQMPTIKDEGEEDEEGETSSVASVSKAVPEKVGEYILNLQVAADSAYSRYLYRKRQACAETFGKDPTYLYPLHISVTGFFETTRSKVDLLVALIHELLSEELSEMRGTEPVLVRECLSVAAGYVLLDVEAPCISEVSTRLAVRSQEIGISIRPKAVNHISLAAGRSDPELRAKIQDLYCEDRKIQHTAMFELVLSRRYSRSSFDRLEQDGPHGFKEVARIPVVTLPSTSPTPPLPPTPPAQVR